MGWEHLVLIEDRAMPKSGMGTDTRAPPRRRRRPRILNIRIRRGRIPRRFDHPPISVEQERSGAGGVAGQAGVPPLLGTVLTQVPNCLSSSILHDHTSSPFQTVMSGHPSHMFW